MMTAIDPVTIAALLIGLMTAAGFMLVAAGVDGAGSRRMMRRLQAIKDRKPGAASGDSKVRSLTKRESATPRIDQLVRRWLPRREILIARLARTGRDISVGQYCMINVGVIAFIDLLIMLTIGVRPMPALLLATGIGVGVCHFVIGRMGKRRIATFLNLFPEAIDLMVRALRSGLPISEAIINAAHEIGDPIGAEFSTIEAGMRLGRELESLLWEIAKRI